MKNSIIFKSFMLVSIWIIVSACGSGKGFESINAPSSNGSDAEANSIPRQSLDTFEQTLYPLLAQNCAGCHASFQSPQFADSDTVAAHEEALDLVDFVNPNNSLIVQIISEGHQGFGPPLDAQLVEAINEWSNLR